MGKGAGALNPERLAVVEGLLKLGEDNSTIERNLAQPPPLGWGCSERTIRRYINRVVRRWAKEANPKQRDRERGKIRAALWDVFRDARSTDLLDNQGKVVGHKKPRLRDAITALQRLMQLEGLAVTRMELTGADGAPLEVSSDAAAATLAKAIDRATAGDAGGGTGEPPTG